jgi:hypothetical protein
MLLDNSKLAKVLALVDSPNAGESQAAINRVTVLLQSAGRTWRDLPEIMGAPHARDFEDFCEEQEPGYKAGQAEELRQKQRQEAAAFLKDVITRYGSRRAALAPSPMERAVDRAVAPFVREQKCEDLNGHFPTTTLDGWWQLELPAPDHVQEAVVRALPLPKTIREALDE